MNESNSIRAIDRKNQTEQAKSRLDEIRKIENYFHQEINQRKSCSKKLNKYVTIFDYIDKILIVLSATSGEACIISSVKVVRAPIAIAGASFTLIISLTTTIVKQVLSIRRNKKRIIRFFCWLKVNSISLKF